MDRLKIILLIVFAAAALSIGFIAYRKLSLKPSPPSVTKDELQIPKIKIAINNEPTSATFIVFKILKRLDLARLNGIEIENVPAQSFSGFQALLNGTVDIALYSSTIVSKQNLEMEDKIKIFSPALISDQVIMKAQSAVNIQNLKELNGKKIGVLERTTMPYMEFAVASLQQGIDPEKGIKSIASPIPLLASMLEKKEVIAISSTYPRVARLIASGKAFPVFSFPEYWRSSFNIRPPSVGWAAYSKWIDSHRKEAKAFADAYLTAAIYVIDHPELFDEEEIRREIGIINDQEADIWKNEAGRYLLKSWSDKDIADEIKFLEMAKEVGLIGQDSPTDIFIKL